MTACPNLQGVDFKAFFKKAKMIAKLLSIRRGYHISAESVAINLAESPRRYNFPIETLVKATKLAEQGALKWAAMGQLRATHEETARAGAKKWLNKARDNPANRTFNEDDSEDDYADSESVPYTNYARPLIWTNGGYAYDACGTDSVHSDESEGESEGSLPEPAEPLLTTTPSATPTRRGSTEWLLTREKCFDDFGCKTPEGFPSNPWMLYNASDNSGEIYFSKSSTNPFTVELWHSLNILKPTATPHPEPGISVNKIAHDAVKVIDNRVQKKRRRKRKKKRKTSPVTNKTETEPNTIGARTKRARRQTEVALMKTNAGSASKTTRLTARFRTGGLLRFKEPENEAGAARSASPSPPCLNSAGFHELC